MKSVIYIEDGILQLVLTPQSVFEKNILAQFQTEKISTNILSGTFYSCQGGWEKHSKEDQSLIVRVEKGENK